MFDLIKSNILLLILGLFVLKYLIQIYFSITNRKQVIAFVEKPFVHSILIWLNALPLFVFFLIKSDSLNNLNLGFTILFLGILIGIWGLINLNKNYHDDLVFYKESKLIKTGIFSVVRHPIRLGICLEVSAIFVFISSIYFSPLLFMFYFLNYKRTIKEEQFLLKIYKEDAIEYFENVPRFNLLKGVFRKFVDHNDELQLHS